MAKRHPDGSLSSAPMKAEKSKEEDGSMNGLHEAAQDLLMALNEKSPQKLMEALAAFIELYSLKQQEAPSEADSE